MWQNPFCYYRPVNRWKFKLCGYWIRRSLNNAMSNFRNCKISRRIIYCFTLKVHLLLQLWIWTVFVPPHFLLLVGSRIRLLSERDKRRFYRCYSGIKVSKDGGAVSRAELTIGKGSRLSILPGCQSNYGTKIEICFTYRMRFVNFTLISITSLQLILLLQNSFHRFLDPS